MATPPAVLQTSMSASAEVGTAAYMAPEVFAGRLTKASDVFSFGILSECGAGLHSHTLMLTSFLRICVGPATLPTCLCTPSLRPAVYEVWMRRRAWPGLPLAKLIFAVVSQHSRPPVPPGCPDGYAALMQQCWADAPEER